MTLYFVARSSFSAWFFHGPYEDMEIAKAQAKFVAEVLGGDFVTVTSCTVPDSKESPL